MNTTDNKYNMIQLDVDDCIKEVKVVDDIDQKILEETNQHIQTLAEELTELYEIMTLFPSFLKRQGEQLDDASQNIETSEQNVDQSTDTLNTVNNNITEKRKKIRIRDATILASGTAIGSIGWFGGPWIGVPTTAIGVGISTGIVLLIHRIVDRK